MAGKFLESFAILGFSLKIFDLIWFKQKEISVETNLKKLPYSNVRQL